MNGTTRNIAQEVEKEVAEARAGFRELLAEVMEEKGIEGLEDLYARYMQTRFQRWRNRKRDLSYKEFARHANAQIPDIRPEFSGGLFEALKLDGEEAKQLMCMRMFGPKRGEPAA